MSPVGKFCPLSTRVGPKGTPDPVLDCSKLQCGLPAMEVLVRVFLDPIEPSDLEKLCSKGEPLRLEVWQ